MPKKEIEEKEICEYGIAYDQSREYRAVRGFFLQTKHGPLTEIKSGSLVRLSDRTSQELFYANKVSPLEVGTTFEALVSFRTIGSDGGWLDVQEGDVIEMGREEALTSLRRKQVKEKIGGVE